MNMQERLDSPFAYHLDPGRHEAITGCGAWRPVLRGPTAVCKTAIRSPSSAAPAFHSTPKICTHPVFWN
jgi:hypothetical protein